VRKGLVAITLAAAIVATGCGSSSAVRTVTVNDGVTTTDSGAGYAPLTLNAASALRALQRAGMPIGQFVNYTAASDDNHLLGRPGMYVTKVNFRDTRIPAVGDFDTEGGGSIETFENKDDAQRRYDYVHAITSGSSLFFEYEYLRGTVFLRLSKVLTPDQAAGYERAFERLVP
jgi:hypothetical protein